MQIDFKNVLLGLGASTVVIASLFVAFVSFQGNNQPLTGSLTNPTDVRNSNYTDPDFKPGGFCLNSSGPIAGTVNAKSLTFDALGNMWFIDGKDLSYIDANGNKKTFTLNLKMSDLVIVGNKYYVADLSNSKESYLKKYYIDQNNNLALEWSKKISTAGGSSMYLAYSSKYDFVYALAEGVSKYSKYWVTQDGKGYGPYTKTKSLLGAKSFNVFDNKSYIVIGGGVDILESDASGKKSVKESSFGNLNDARDIAFFNDKIYVSSDNGFYIFDLNGNFINKTTTINSVDIAISSDGTIYYKKSDGVYKLTLNGPCATLTVVKDVTPDYSYSTDFLFNITYSPKFQISNYLIKNGFCLDDDAFKDSTCPNSETFYLLPGDYSVFENDPGEQWQTSYRCESNSGNTIDSRGGPGLRADITLKAGDNVTCTFINDCQKESCAKI